MTTLLLGASFSAVPIFNRLVRAGQDVTVVGSLREDPCHRISKRSIFSDYSEFEVVADIWAKGEFNFIVPTCNDAAMKTATALASEFALPGFDSVENFSQIANKDEFRNLCHKLGLRAPRTIFEVGPESPVEDLEVDCKALVKPVDSFSGIGISLADKNVTKIQLERALNASRIGKALIEEFVEGSLHSHSAFIESGRIVWQDFVDEFCEVNRYQVNRSLYPSSLSEEVREAVSREIQTLVAHLNLTDGLIHTQFIAKESNHWLIESMRRCPGDLFGTHFLMAKEFDYYWNYVAPFVNEDFNMFEQQTTNVVSRQVLSSSDPINFYGASFESKESETLFIPLHTAGDDVQEAPLGKTGIIFQAGKGQPLVSNCTIIESQTF